jgi:hypothetical protein
VDQVGFAERHAGPQGEAIFTADANARRIQRQSAQNWIVNDAS